MTVLVFPASYGLSNAYGRIDYLPAMLQTIMRFAYAASAVFLSFALSCGAQISADLQAKIADIANGSLKQTGVPSASIAIAEHGKIVYAQAFGLANVAPAVPAKPEMAYPIGSVSKQFTAQALLLLQQRGKLSIDDPVSKYFPSFTRANEVTLRNLMTMTSGYEDFAPQDYIIPAWRKSIDPLKNATEWATKPLDFDPGTDWQYSNTNYVILGLVIEKVSGEPLMQFMRKNLLDPLQLKGVFNSYIQRENLKVTGYVSYALAPVRVQPLEGDGWYFGDGDLAMPASTLASWDIGIMEQKLLSVESYKQFETPFVLKNGANSNYGLGIFVRSVNGHREYEHSGEVGGYVSENMVLPDDLDGLAIVVLTNEVASRAAHDIGRDVATLLVPTLKAASQGHSQDTLLPTLKSLLTQLQQGTIDRNALTANCNDYFSADALLDFQHTLAPLGQLTDLVRASTQQRGGMTGSLYRATYSNGVKLTISTYTKPDGKIEQLLITARE